MSVNATHIRHAAGAPAQVEPDDVRTSMIAYQAGRIDAFEHLYDALAPMLRHFLASLAHDAFWVDDLLQETFLQIHRARRTYNPAFPVRPWAVAIARHVFLMSRRTRRRHPDYQPADLEGIDPAEGPVQDERQAVLCSVRRSLAGLTPGTRRAVVLHHMFDMTFDEVGRVLGMRETAAKLRVSRAVRAIRKRWPGGWTEC